MFARRVLQKVPAFTRSMSDAPPTFTRNAVAVWKGTLQEGSGTYASGSGLLMPQLTGPYSVPARFSNDNPPGTNPEEMIAAAHASCFSMALSAGLGNGGFKPESISTSAKVKLEKKEGGWEIVEIQLVTQGKVPGISAEQFAKLAEDTKLGCPISKALAAVPRVTLDAKLLN